MPRRAQWALRASSGLLFLAGYMALASVQGMGAALLIAAVVVLALSPFAERLDRASQGYRLITRAITVVYFCLLPLSWLNLGLLNAVIALVIYIQFYTMLHVKEEKSYYHLFLMSFFLLLAACSMAPEASIGIVLAVFLGATIWAFFSLRVAYEAEESQSHVPADIVRFGEEPLRVAHDHRDPFDAGIVAYIFLIAILALGATGTIFFLTPRVEAGLIGRNNAPVSVTAVPESVRLNSGQTIQQDPTPVLRAEFPDSPGGRPEVSALYWRITTLPKFDGAGWQRARLRQSGEPDIRTPTSGPWRAEAFEVSRPRRPQARTVHQVLYMDDVPTSGVPVMDLVQRLFATGQPRGTKLDWDSNTDFTVQLNRDGARQLHYEAWSEIDEPTPEMLRTASGDYTLDESDLELLTEQQLLQETIALARQVTAGQANTYDKVIALTDYLSGPNYVYSLTVPLLPAEYAVDAFINQARTGHCELYATALALMVRSLGIPARVVSGYKGGEYQEGDGAYIVRRSMAHLWVEVLFPQYGWVKFDPSPQSEDNAPVSVWAQLRQSASLLALKARMLWFRDVVGFQGTRVLDLNQLRYRLVGAAQELQAKAGDPAVMMQLVRTVSSGVVGIGVAIGAAWFAYRWFSDGAALRRSPLGHYTLTRDQSRAIRVYRKLRRKLRRAGVDVTGKTAEEIREIMEATDWPIRQDAIALLDEYNDIRFGARPYRADVVTQLLKALTARRARA